jgi:hypothetical protein
METQLPTMYSKGLFEEKCLDLAAAHTDKIFDVLFSGTANLLKVVKTKEHPVAFVFKTIDKTFLAAAIIRYFESDEESNPGNWSLVWTFNEDDVPEDTTVLDFSDPQTHSYFIAVAGSKYGIEFNSDSNLTDCLVYALYTLKKWLDENAKENEEVMVELYGIFEARVAVENGVKIFALTPGAEVKVAIKDDSMIEK